MGNAKAFGLTDEQANKLQDDILPTYNLSELKEDDSAVFVGISDKPKTVKFTDKETKEEREDLVLDAKEVKSGVNHALWLSSQSLRQEFYKLHQKKGTLKDVKFRISVRMYEHKKFGNTRGYTVQEE